MKNANARTAKQKRTLDVNQAAYLTVKRFAEATEKPEEPTDAELSRVMAALGRRGGKIGGKRRMVTLTQEQRSRIAYKAAQARWSKKKTTKP